MSINVGDSLKGALERLTTSAAGILLLGLTLFGVVRAAATQDLIRALIERILTEFQNPDFRADLDASQLETLEAVEAEFQTFINDLPLALGLSPGGAIGVWIIAYILGLVVAVIAIDTFGNNRDTLNGIETENIGWKVFHLFVGTVLFFILFVIGLIFLVIPGLLVGVLFLYFPAAVVIDDKSVFGAFFSSMDIARNNLLASAAIVLLGFLVSFVSSPVGTAIGGALPAELGAIATQLISAVGVLFMLAVIAQAYVSAGSEKQPPGGQPSPPTDRQPPSPPQ